MEVGDQRHAPVALALKREAVLIVKEAGCVPGPVWTGAENLAQPGFDPPTVQPLASRYTNCTIPGPQKQWTTKFTSFSE
jgi:hypothetical protein